MNITNTYVSRTDFRRALKRKVYEKLNVDFNDLPDIICIDDHWYEGMDERDAIIALEGIIEDIELELGMNSNTHIDAPIYSIDE